MRYRRFHAAAAVLLAGACGPGTPETPAPSTVELGYSMPAVNPVMYASADTVRVNIDLGPGQVMEQVMGQTSQVRLAFAPAMGTAGHLNVTAEFVDFNAFMEMPMAPRVDMGDEMVQGQFQLSLTPEGEAEVVSGPELPEELQGMMMGDNLFEDFFTRLPAETVTPGASWTDTIRAESEEGAPASSMTEAIVVSTFRGDTTVAGRTLWIIDSNSTVNVLTEAESQGMQMRSELTGSSSERTLWDPARRVMYSSDASGTMSGTVSIPAAGMADIPLDVTNTRSVRLVEGS